MSHTAAHSEENFETDCMLSVHGAAPAAVLLDLVRKCRLPGARTSGRSGSGK